MDLDIEMGDAFDAAQDETTAEFPPVDDILVSPPPREPRPRALPPPAGRTIHG